MLAFVTRIVYAVANLITWAIAKLIPGTIFPVLALCHHFAILVHLFVYPMDPILYRDYFIELPPSLPPPPPWAALVKGSLSLGQCSPSCSPDNHPTHRHPWGEQHEIPKPF